MYLDDKPIGYHHFTITQAGEFEQLTTQAQFDVEFLKIPLFRYRHENTERWSSQCLNSITSTTDENGTLFRVDGSVTDTGFRISSNAGVEEANRLGIPVLVTDHHLPGETLPEATGPPPRAERARSSPHSSER